MCFTDTNNLAKMHILQPKQMKLSPNEVEKLLNQYNISLTQLPKIKITDASLGGDCEIGDVVKIERVTDGKKSVYFRVVSI